MNTQDQLLGTFHLRLNASVTRDYEDIEYFVKEWSSDPQMAHHHLKPALELLIITVKSYLPRKRETIKNSLEKLYEQYPRNINVLANLVYLYGSLLLKKSEQLQSQLTQLLDDQSANGTVDRARALAERAFVLIGDVASQEISDDVAKLKEAIEWFSRAIEDGKIGGMDDEEILIWTFYLAKSRFRLENRYREERHEEHGDARKQNFAAMLDCFGRVYLSGENKPELAVYRAMALVYPAEIFSLRSDHGLPAVPQLYMQNSELQKYHLTPVDGCLRAVNLYDCYAVHNRFARVLMNQGKFPDALLHVNRSLKMNPVTNWFGYCTRMQIYKNWYHSERKKKNVCKNMLKEALKGADSCPYRSASMLLDIADIHYCLGVDPFTEEPVEAAELERAVEYVMLARERVEGYKNARAHARLAHCLWALGSRRPAIECMKRAIELEKPGYPRNIQNLCDYLLISYRDGVGDIRPRIALEAAAVFATGQEKLGPEKFRELLLSRHLPDVLRQILRHMMYMKECTELAEKFEKLFIGADPGTVDPAEQFPAVQEAYTWQQPETCQSPGFQHDFFIVCAEEDYSLAFDVLKELESCQCEGYSTFKGSQKLLH